VEINRNQYMMFGTIVLLLGLQLRYVETFVLNERATEFLAERTGGGTNSATALLTGASGPGYRREIQPPRWCGWCLISIGGILVLHSFALKRPGG
jgi:hypothetical protein